MSLANQPPKKFVGTLVYYNGSEIIAQTAVYEGEALDGSAVGARTRSSIEILGMPATDPVYGCNRRLALLGSASTRFYPSAAHNESTGSH